MKLITTLRHAIAYIIVFAIAITAIASIPFLFVYFALTNNNNVFPYFK